MQAKAIMEDSRGVPLAPCSFTVEQFCIRNSISKTLFRMMRKRGEGPKVMRCGKGGRALRISLEAEQQWVKEREAAQVGSRDAEARSQHCRKAGLAGLKSNRHGSKRPNQKKAGV